MSEVEIRAAQVAGWSRCLAGEGHLSVRELGDGRAVYLDPLFFGGSRLGIGVFGTEEYSDVWDYQNEQIAAAWRAALAWDGEGEPDGWYRHLKTGRRRPGGDASNEIQG